MTTRWRSRTDAADTKARSIEGTLKDLRVLVVDTDPEAAGHVEVALRPGCDRVDLRRSPREALDALRDEAYDLVLCDVTAAQDEDFYLPRITRRNHPGVALILTTTNEEGYPFAEALAAGVDGHLSKPLTSDKLALFFEHRYWQALGREDWWTVRYATAE